MRGFGAARRRGADGRREAAAGEQALEDLQNDARDELLEEIKQQITDDLASFWASTYDDVKKDLKRRYPKHSWPDDPLTAVAVKKG